MLVYLSMLNLLPPGLSLRPTSPSDSRIWSARVPLGVTKPLAVPDVRDKPLTAEPPEPPLHTQEER